MVYEELIDFLVQHIPPQAIIDFRPSPQSQARVDALLSASKGSGLSPDEKREMEQYLMLEHLIQLLKAKARLRQQNE